jgi:hypothetical protein
MYFYLMKRFIIISIVASTGFLWLAEGCKKEKTTGSIPVIALLGRDTTIAGIGYPYVDAGATAYDNEDGDITSKIISLNNVDTTALGTYHVYYNVTDNDGNKAKQVSRTVKVINTK